jgi:riboflavin kinase/FMN adenylyltransferase
MHSFSGGDRIPANLHGAVVAIGNFDGVHRGHQALLETARRRALAAGSPFGVLTFEPHPRLFFRPEQPIFPLSPPPLKQRLLAATGADFLLTLDFNRALANLEPRQFVDQILVERLKASHVVMGYDFHFGHGRKGNPETMRRFGDELAFDVLTVDQVTDDDGLAPFSSSAIRDDLRHGRIRNAAHALGYWWMMTGEVVRGDGRGRALGFPTANIPLAPGVEPLEGIYAVRVAVGGSFHLGAAYIGSRPTFRSQGRFLEIFIFDFDHGIYGERVDTELRAFIRRDAKFDSSDKLVAQMRKDCEEALAQLRSIEAHDPMREFPLGLLQSEGRL